MFTDGFRKCVSPDDSRECEVDGFTCHATIYRDASGDAPWEHGDGHGVVSEWTGRAKRPGERILSSDRSSHRFYDVQASIKKAVEVWGCKPGAAAAKAVEEDYQRLRAWCNDEWAYVGVAVAVWRNGVQLTGDYDHSLWGIESDSGGYLTEVANELLDEALKAAKAKIAELQPAAERNTDHEALLAIQEELDGVEWSSATLERVAEIMVQAGYRIRDLHDRDRPEWSGSQCPLDPDNFWIDDKTGERVNASTGERTRPNKSLV